MKTRHVLVPSFAALAAMLVAQAAAQARPTGRIVVADDGVTISGQGFVQPGDAGVFATNIASWFTGGEPGSFLAHNTFWFNSPDLVGTMSGAGHELTITTGSFTLPILQQYDGVFVAGLPVPSQVLIDYVEGGGSVYVAAGTGALGTPENEAAAWNPFLEHFGLRFHDEWNTALFTTIAVNETHDIFESVDHLWTDRGQGVFDLQPGNTANRIFVPVPGYLSQGHYAVFDGTVCYADCNESGALTVADFVCFQTKFVSGEPYADCNASASLTVADFVCFQTKFIAGCP